jgi:conjugative transposon TraN protein
MKTSIAILSLLIASGFTSFAQETEGILYKDNLPQLTINEDVSLHFISPEPIQYVDISTDNLVGDIPVENVFRIKLTGESLPEDQEPKQTIGVVTIIGQKFIAQYDLHYDPSSSNMETQVEILPRDMNPLDVGSAALSDNQLRDFSLLAFSNKKKSLGIKNSQDGVSGTVNNIYTLDDYIFLDITFLNRSNLKFDIDSIRFKIEDRKILKATNSQAIEIQPEYQLMKKPSFKRRYRNIFVFKKFSFPNNKLFSIELTETQISGRTLSLYINYEDILSADTL